MRHLLKKVEREAIPNSQEGVRHSGCREEIFLSKTDIPGDKSNF
jgi:hypothetical protein